LAHVCANLSLHTNSGLANAADRISANMSNHEARHGSSSDDSGTTEGGHGHGHAKQRGGHGHGKGRPTLGD
jgi:hypothetical protein